MTWDMGDGITVVCVGPGSPYSKEYPAAAKSPDCGHVYTRTSTGKPGEAFTVVATVEWAVEWAVEWEGGGETGTVAGMATSTEMAVRVSEAQALVVR
ncbi:hypothetical protein [Streptomyces smaragdinus]|uniref:hypothetical protein n=1 Tax=Streptomyces smaragdinus TaxID=2585196 RepID=UPI001E4B3A8E|nr:hypothetical protein [Streptomyces smaragdinus]